MNMLPTNIPQTSNLTPITGLASTLLPLLMSVKRKPNPYSNPRTTDIGSILPREMPDKGLPLNIPGQNTNWINDYDEYQHEIDKINDGVYNTSSNLSNLFNNLVTPAK